MDFGLRNLTYFHWSIFLHLSYFFREVYSYVTIGSKKIPVPFYKKDTYLAVCGSCYREIQKMQTLNIVIQSYLFLKIPHIKCS